LARLGGCFGTCISGDLIDSRASPKSRTRFDDIKDVGIDHTFQRHILFPAQDANVQALRLTIRETIIVRYNAIVTPILYSFRRCPYAMRARLALDASGQECELREVKLREKPLEMLRVSSKGTVTVLVVADGEVIDESLDIMLWALGRSDPEHWLTPDLDSLPGTLALIAQFDSHFKQHLDTYKYPDRFAGADSLASRGEACLDVQLLESKLVRTPYLAGERVSLADMAIAPFIRQFANVDASWFSSQPWPAVQRWLKMIVASPRFERVMRTVPTWEPGTRGVSFPVR
jgi:glutathione S-transferase